MVWKPWRNQSYTFWGPTVYNFEVNSGGSNINYKLTLGQIFKIPKLVHINQTTVVKLKELIGVKGLSTILLPSTEF